MPAIHKFAGFKITMYAEDHNPPHVHLVTKEREAILAIRDGSVLAGNAPAKLVAQAQTFIAANRPMLLAR